MQGYCFPCHANFLFSPSATPCTALAPPTNGLIAFISNGNIPGSQTTYACDEGFMLEGSNRRVCQVDGTWTGTAPTCEGK